VGKQTDLKFVISFDGSAQPDIFIPLIPLISVKELRQSTRVIINKEAEDRGYLYINIQTNCLSPIFAALASEGILIRITILRLKNDDIAPSRSSQEVFFLQAGGRRRSQCYSGGEREREREREREEGERALKRSEEGFRNLEMPPRSLSCCWPSYSH
jgi:hypothetical protein